MADDLNLNFLKTIAWSQTYFTSAGLIIMSEFFTVLIDDKPTRFEKKRIMVVEPYEFGTKITMEASHEDEEPIIYFTSEPHELVMKSYLS